MFLATMIIQLLSAGRLIRFLSQSKIIRGGLYILLIPLSLLYTYDVFSMLLYFWGVPAFAMTRWSLIRYD